MSKRLENEVGTVRVMIGMFCRRRHGPALCGQCRDLMEYVEQRLEKCPYGDGKPACSKCDIHCYQPEMRARIREVMRFAGPRMVLTHPVLALRHWRANR